MAEWKEEDKEENKNRERRYKRRIRRRRDTCSREEWRRRHVCGKQIIHSVYENERRK